MVDICDDCYLEREIKITKCDNCCRYFIKWDISTQPIVCPHCNNDKMRLYGCNKDRLNSFVEKTKNLPLNRRNKNEK